MVEIRNYPAKNGDAFLVKASKKPFTMLIDGGYAETFQRYIKPDLVNLAANGLELDVVVATHIDADHISGLLSLIRVNGQADAPTIIPIRDVLHNSLRSLVAPIARIAAREPVDVALLNEIRLRAYPPPVISGNIEEEISARQGSSFADLLRNGGYRWNTFDGTLAVRNGLVDLCLPNAYIKILGPNEARLGALRKWWISEIRRLGVVGTLEGLDDVFEFLCAHEVPEIAAELLASSDGDLAHLYVPDNSITNGSSISLLLEIEDLRFLFLGDAPAEDIVTALKPDGPTVLDAIKVAHHGSMRNTSPELLMLIDSPHFLISTNGEGHDHPDFAVLKAIVDRPAPFRRTLHFNYPTVASRTLKNYRSKSGTKFAIEEGQTGWVTLSDRNAL